MSDPKSAKTEPKSNDSNKAHAEEVTRAASSPQRRLIAIGRLRRDTMILGSDEDAEAIGVLAASAVREGRAAEVYIIEAVGYFSESEIDFQPPAVASRAQYADQTDARVPLLNPSTGEQSLDNSNPDDSKAAKAETPSGGAKAGGDDNKGAGTGTGNEAKTADQ